MIFRRTIANLRAQNWMAIGIELAIVVVGVIIGMQVSNWNEDRIARRETEKMLSQMVPELESQLEFFDSLRTYYATTRTYANQALAAWNGSQAISDDQFVIAAYQASQISGSGINAENWALTFGGDQLRNIADPSIRRNMEIILTSDFEPIGLNAAASPYREQVRRVIPIGIQDDIRRVCGDRPVTGEEAFIIFQLPKSCSLKIPKDQAGRVAAALRARPELADELNWHLATVAVSLTNVDVLERPFRKLHSELSKSFAGQARVEASK